jgi:tetratricopeptide (TPR) repeat protein
VVAAILAAVGMSAGLVWAWPRLAQTPLERARHAYARGDWGRTANYARAFLNQQSNDPLAWRLLARAEARLGRDEQALAAFEGLGAEVMDADDSFAFGMVCERKGWLELALSAFDSALDLQPRHLETLEAKVRLEGESNRKDVRARVEQLDAVRAPRARLAFILALARLARTGADTVSAVFQKLLAQDPARLRGVTSVDQAMKLLARLLLEAGKPHEARALLERLPRADGETQWLTSRAHLQLGQAALAAEALERASGFSAALSPAAREPAPYVGETRCAECHRAACQLWSRGRHAHTLRLASELADLPVPAAPFSDPRDPAVSYRVRHEGNAIQVTASVRGEVKSGVAEYLFGSGRHGTTFLVRDEQGNVRKMRMSHYADDDKWDLTSRKEPDPENLADYLGRVIEPESLGQCLNCHTTVGASVRDRSGPEAADHAIGCERCHGPGGNHVRAVNAGFPELAIGELGLASAAARLSVCAECHRSDGTLEPIEPGFARFQTPNLIQSRCYVESQELDCTTCHQPHRDLSHSTARYESKCLECHRAGTRKSAGPSRLFTALPCPVNAANDCIGCHMPKVNDESHHTRFTDHFIRVHRENGSVQAPHPAAGIRKDLSVVGPPK